MTALPAVAPRAPLLRMRSDEKLAALAVAGREDAFDALFARHKPGLLAYCEHALGSYDAACEALPDIRGAAHAALSDADDCPDCAKVELYRAARGQCRAQSPTDDTVAGMGTLAEPERTALILRELDTLTYGEMAQALDTTEPVVKALLVQARVALAEARCALAA